MVPNCQRCRWFAQRCTQTSGETNRVGRETEFRPRALNERLFNAVELTNMTRPLLVFVLLTFSAIARADLVAAKCDGPKEGAVTAVSGSGGCIGFARPGLDGGSTQVQFPSPMSGQLFVTADGRSVVMVASYLSGFLEKGRVISRDMDGRDAPNPIVMRIFRDGQEVAAHRIEALLGRPARLESSISHVRWMKACAVEAEGVRLTLLDGTSLVIDLLSGTRLSR